VKTNKKVNTLFFSVKPKRYSSKTIHYLEWFSVNLFAFWCRYALHLEQMQNVILEDAK